MGQRFVSVLFSHTESGHSRVLNNFHSCLILQGNLYSFLCLRLKATSLIETQDLVAYLQVAFLVFPKLRTLE